MTRDDYIKFGLQITETLSNDRFKALALSLDSTKVFGSRGSPSADFRSTKQDHTRACIHLAKPICNPILAGSNFKYVQSIFQGYSTPIDPDIRKVLQFEIVWSVTKHKWIRRTDAENDDEILCGVEAARDQFMCNDLERFFTDYISVVPLGMRPDIATKHDPLTFLYNSVLEKNKLVMCAAGTAQESIASYQALQYAVNRLVVETDARFPNRKSILNLLGSKEGLIRNRMLGKRTDYSGRAVITIDPNLSISEAAIPREFIPKLFRNHLIKTYTSPQLTDILGVENNAKMCRRAKDKQIPSKIPVLIGRQPTIHRQSMLSFNTKTSDTKTIQLNPLCVSVFNADFDGDQMWCKVFNSSEAILDLFSKLHISSNLRSTDTGTPNFVPRLEILHGLNICTRDYPVSEPVEVFQHPESVIPELISRKMRVSDYIIHNGADYTAGRLAVYSCLSPYFNITDITEINSISIKHCMSALLNKGRKVFCKVLDKLVALGFKIAELYPIALPIFKQPNLSELFTELNNLDTAYHDGFLDTGSYSDLYTKEVDIINNKCKKYVDFMDTGFTQLYKSGARGDATTVSQIYICKGNVNNVFIKDSFINQLSPLEHFCCATSARKNLITKNLEASESGYFSRQLWHTTQSVRITCYDCGTADGILISKQDIQKFSPDINSVFRDMVVGRIEAGTNTVITAEKADTSDSLVIRSPITCRNPCCSRCYSTDLSTGNLPQTDTQVGLHAAHCIGKVGLQSNMNAFKTVENIQTSFADVAQLNEQSVKNSFNYDPVAWAEGSVHIKQLLNGMRKIYIEGSRKSVNVKHNLPIKDRVRQGEFLCVTEGLHSIRELQSLIDVRTAQLYLLHTFFNFARNSTDINSKHFEVLISAMTLACIVETDRLDLSAGTYVDLYRLYSGDLENTTYNLEIFPVHSVPLKRAEPFSQLAMEALRDRLAKATLYKDKDFLRLPIPRMLFGLGLEREKLI
jgi:hypothetical protein